MKCDSNTTEKGVFIVVDDDDDDNKDDDRKKCSPSVVSKAEDVDAVVTTPATTRVITTNATTTSSSVAAITTTRTPTTSGSAAKSVIRNPYKRNVSMMSSESKSSSSSSSSSNSGSNSNNSAAKAIYNPYQKQQRPNDDNGINTTRKQQPLFIGGAQLARLQAQKQKNNKRTNNNNNNKKNTNRGTMIPRPGDAQRLETEVLPKNMNPMERFFAALLRSSASDFVVATSSAAVAPSLASSSSSLSFASSGVWETACHRVGLTVPTQPVQSTYENVDRHFEVRAALVLEEARHAIASGLQRLLTTTSTNRNRNNWSMGTSSRKQMILRAHYIEMIPSSKHSKISFIKEKNDGVAAAAAFTKDQLYDIRPGTVFACLPRDLARNLQNVILGVVTTANYEQIRNNVPSFQVVVFRDLPSKSEDAEWVVIPIAALITELRCFEAMTNKAKNIGFLNDLLGRRKRTHIRFDDDGEVVEPCRGDVEMTTTPAAASTSNVETTVARSARLQQQQQDMFRIPRLNAAQEKAATDFLQSAPNTISLVQGPPGTGKTTFLVNIICQYVLESYRLLMSSSCGSSSSTHGKKKLLSGQRRLLVCAPTNKAVSVLASRFLNVMNQDSYPCNIILAGDAEKLLGDEQQDHRKPTTTRTKNSRSVVNEHRSLRTIFLYSWMQVLIDEYKTIQDYFVQGNSIMAAGSVFKENVYLTAKRLEQRLTNSLRDLPQEVVQIASGITSALERLKNGGHVSGSGLVVSKIGALIKQLAAMPQDTVWKELMRSADVIFCTLASSGGMQFMRSDNVDDLIVDEAAAASEPELCIPFHLKPSRMLAVGDPKQLPATVLSQRAADLGYSKSLHERLMYECSFDYMMLDTQYRMNPLISSFPSQRFYNSKLCDGENVADANYQRGSLCPLLLDKAPYTCLQVNGLEEQIFGGSYRNHAEAKVIVELVRAIQSVAEVRIPKWHSADRVRIITFYQAQVGLIKSLLRKDSLEKKIAVATVDSSQGCEADLVIVSFVRSPAKDKTDLSKYDAGFLTDDRRMNVALTRAKHQLICVGNIHAIQHMHGATTLQLLAQDALTRHVVQPYLTPRNNSDANTINATLDLFYGPPVPKKAKY